MERHIDFMREWEGGDNRLTGQWRKTEREGEVSLEEEWEDVKKIEPEMKNWTRDGWKDTDKEGETEEESIERGEKERQRGGRETRMGSSTDRLSSLTESAHVQWRESATSWHTDTP